jgi:hypothetical protein
VENIHILPTDKTSRIYLIKSNNRLGINSNNPEFTENFGSGTQNQHIYITSDETAKKGDWTFDGSSLYKWTDGDIEDMLHNPGCKDNVNKGCEKIILTTDQDLIKDGVQAIDDEFLEWFINNPCEEVKLDSICKCISCGSSVKSSCDYAYKCNPQIFYKIIIPKEEPKQNKPKNDAISKELLERAFINAKKHIKIQNNITKYRAAGFLEGVLFAFNELEEGKDFVFKNIEYEEIGWFGGKTIKTRKQNYCEFIIDKFENFIKK